MTLEDLANELRRMWHNADEGKRTTILRLFSIKYSEHLPARGNRRDIVQLLRLAGLSTALVQEVQKGRDLAKYVDVKREYL